MKRTSLKIDHNDPGDEDAPHTAEPRVPPLSDEEIVEIRFHIFGKCPVCGNHIRNWNPGAFNPEKYEYWREAGIDPLTGHKLGCDRKWLR